MIRRIVDMLLGLLPGNPAVCQRVAEPLDWDPHPQTPLPPIALGALIVLTGLSLGVVMGVLSIQDRQVQDKGGSIKGNRAAYGHGKLCTHPVSPLSGQPCGPVCIERLPCRWQEGK